MCFNRLPCPKDVDGASLKAAPGVAEVIDAKTRSKLHREPDYKLGDLLCSWDWKFAFSASLPPRGAHINETELQAAINWAKRVARNGPKYRRRFLLLCDSRVATGAINHGRSPSPRINRLLRRLIPICVGSECYFSILWIPTECNPSDPVSRGRPLWRWIQKARADRDNRQRQNEAKRQQLRRRKLGARRLIAKRKAGSALEELGKHLDRLEVE